MTQKFISGLIIGAVVGVTTGVLFAYPSVPTPQIDLSRSRATGNGAPSGSHYNLNIIGVPKTKTADMTGSSGHRIFVSLGAKKPAEPVSTKIMLSQSADGTFQVLDANGTDGTARFQLPAPGTYSIWARPLGKPGGQAQITTCAMSAGVDGIFGTADDEEVCSTGFEVFVRGTGGSKFRDVTYNLTTVVLDPVEHADVVTACGGLTAVSLFDPCLEGYFWDYDNNGLKLLQLRFYPN